ncbi:S41 family peptidase [Bacillus infantis]|uniref:S41 family peptidase n=1 Tax=Bacillus infantis TaxID=324767 RepID=UPI003CF8FC6B
MKKYMVLFLTCFIFLSGCEWESHAALSKDEIMKKEMLKSEDLLSPAVMKKDFDFMKTKILQIHPDPKRNIDNWDKAVSETEKKIKRALTAMEFAQVLMEFTSRLKDPHTTVIPSGEMLVHSKTFPATLEWVKEGLVVTKSFDSTLKAGDLILKMGGRSPEELNEKLSKLISAENEYWEKKTSLALLHYEIFLKEISIAEKDDTVKATIERDGKQLKAEVKLLENNYITTGQSKEWFNWEIQQDRNIAYFNLDTCLDTIGYQSAVDSFFQETVEKGIDNIVIDLRGNGGGDTGVTNSFLKHLPAANIQSIGYLTKYSTDAAKRYGYRRTKGVHNIPSSKVENLQDPPIFTGKIYIASDSGTFSSAAQFAVIFQDNNLAEVIGETSGGNPEGFSDYIFLSLPYSRFDLVISHKEYFRPNQEKSHLPYIVPDVMIEKTRKDIISGQDGQLERIFDYVEKNGQK